MHRKLKTQDVVCTKIENIDGEYGSEINEENISMHLLGKRKVISVKIAYSGDGGGSGGEDSRSREWEICSRGREGGHSDTSQ